MAGTRRPALPARVGVVGERIEHWRRRRQKHSAMPEELWGAAVFLARQHGVWPIARALGVSYATLKERAARIGTARGKKAGRHGGFVEIDGAELIGSAHASVTVLELTDAHGAKLTVRLAGAGGLDVAALADAFWRRGR